MGCTHFVWSNGECERKHGLVVKSDAILTGSVKSICGILNKQIIPGKIYLLHHNIKIA